MQTTPAEKVSFYKIFSNAKMHSRKLFGIVCLAVLLCYIYITFIHDAIFSGGLIIYFDDASLLVKKEVFNNICNNERIIENMLDKNFRYEIINMEDNIAINIISKDKQFIETKSMQLVEILQEKLPEICHVDLHKEKTYKTELLEETISKLNGLSNEINNLLKIKEEFDKKKSNSKSNNMLDIFNNISSRSSLLEKIDSILLFDIITRVENYKCSVNSKIVSLRNTYQELILVEKKQTAGLEKLNLCKFNTKRINEINYPAFTVYLICIGFSVFLYFLYLMFYKL